MRHTARLLTVAALLLSPLALPSSPAAAEVSGSRIYFFADIDTQGVYGLYSRAVEGGPTKRLVAGHAGIDMDFAQVSPDGTQVAYLLTDAHATQLWTVDVGGFNAVRRRVFASRDSFGIRWTKDSKKLLLNDTASADPRVRLFDVAAGTTTVVPNSDYFSNPTYDPAHPATRIVGNYPGDKVVSMPLNGSASPTSVAGSPVDTARPVLSSDGLTVAFTHFTNDSDTDPTSDLLTLKGGARKVIATGLYNARPTIGQDGATVYYDKVAGQSLDFIGDLYSVPIDGSAAETRLTSTPDVDEYSVSAAAEDNTAPRGVVTGLTATIGTFTTRLTWTPSADADATDVMICRTDGDTAPTAPCAAPVYRGPGSTRAVGNSDSSQVVSYTVFTMDHAGNAAATGASISVQEIAVTGLGAFSPTSSHAPTLPFRVTWGTGGTPGVSYVLTYATKSGPTWALGPWQPWTTTTAATGVFGASGAPITPKTGESYYLRSYGVDAYGNHTTAATARAVVPLDDTASTYSSGWSVEKRDGRWLGAIHGTTTPGAQAVIRMTGASYSVIAEQCRSCGTFRVYVDGVLQATVNTHSGSYRSRQTVWTGTFGATKARNVRVQAVSGRVNVDGFATYR